MAIVTVGIDLAKNVFAVHGVDEFGKPVLVRPEVSRAKLLELIASLPPCLIGMEACSGAHHWAREFARFGHTVRMMAPKFVVPYRMSGKRGKNDAADAAAMGTLRIAMNGGRRDSQLMPLGSQKAGTGHRRLPLHADRLKAHGVDMTMRRHRQTLAQLAE